MKKNTYAQIQNIVESTIKDITQDLLAQITSEDTEEAEVITETVGDKDAFVDAYYDIVAENLDCDAIIQCVLQEIRNQILSHQ